MTLGDLYSHGDPIMATMLIVFSAIGIFVSVYKGIMKLCDYLDE